MDEIVLKYDKDVAIKTGAFTQKLFVFLLCIAALIVLISSAIFDFFCYYKGISNLVIAKCTSKIVYTSMFLLFLWLISVPIWYPAYIAENLVLVKKGKKFYFIKNKKDHIFDKKNDLDNLKFLNKIVKELPKENENIIIKEYDFESVIRKTKKYAIIQLVDGKKNKRVKIYNIYDNFDKLN